MTAFTRLQQDLYDANAETIARDLKWLGKADAVAAVLRDEPRPGRDVWDRLAAEGPPIDDRHMPLVLGHACHITGPAPGTWVRLSAAIEHADQLLAESGR